MDHKAALGVVAIIIGIAAYIPYLRDLFRGKTRPHVFSWFIWGLMTAIGFFAQISEGAGAGAWIGAFTASVSFFIAIYALRRGEKNITPLDWASFLGAVLAIAFWMITKEPLVAVILIVIIDALGFVPTFRKSYTKPHEETLVSYFLNGTKFIPALFALEVFSPTTALYPIYLVVANYSFVAMLMTRRKVKREIIKAC